MKRRPDWFRKKTKARKELDAVAAFLCLDYLKTIMPSESIARIELEISLQFLNYKTKAWRKRKRDTFETDNVALILERLNNLEDKLYLNARVIRKLDQHPLRQILDAK